MHPRFFLLILGFLVLTPVYSQHPTSEAYLEDAYQIYSSGEVIKGSDSIKTFQKGLYENIELSFTLRSIAAKHDSTIYYQIGGFHSSSGDEFKYIRILNRQEDQYKRELEFLSKTENLSSIPEIDKARTIWMELCNKHNAEQLVKHMYAKRPFYYNHKPLIDSAESLIQEYSYMNNPNYRLTLTPLIVEPVKNDLVYEIGQCSGSYNGKYVIVWIKEADGEWRVLLDSNI